MDLDNVAQNDVAALEKMGFARKWIAYVLSYFHGSREQAVQFLLDHNDRLMKISNCSNKVTIDDIIALGFSAVDITQAMVENSMDMEVSVQFLLQRKHLLSGDSTAFESPSQSENDRKAPLHTSADLNDDDSQWSEPSAELRMSPGEQNLNRRLSNAPHPASIPLPKAGSRRGSLLPPKVGTYNNCTLPLRFDLPVDVDPDVFFSHPEAVQLEQQRVYASALARERQSHDTPSIVGQDAQWEHTTATRTFWIYECVVRRHPTLRLGIQLRGPPDWHLIIVALKCGPNGEIGPAQEAGLQVGDILLAVNNHCIRGLKDLSYLTTVTKQGDDSLLRVARAEDLATRNSLIAQAMNDVPSIPIARRLVEPNESPSKDSLSPKIGYTESPNSTNTSVSSATKQVVNIDDSSQKNYKLSEHGEREQNTKNVASIKAETLAEEHARQVAIAKANEAETAQQHREFLIWLRKTTPTAPPNWKPCFLAMNANQQKKLYTMKKGKQRRRHMAIAAGFYEFITTRMRNNRWRGSSSSTTGPDRAHAQLECVLQPVYREEGLHYFEQKLNISRPAAEKHYQRNGHPFSGTFGLADGKKIKPPLTPLGKAIANSGNHFFGNDDNSKVASTEHHDQIDTNLNNQIDIIDDTDSGTALELSNSLKTMLVSEHSQRVGGGSSKAHASSENDLDKNEGDWKSRFGNFFKKMGGSNKNAEYATRLKTYSSMLHEYDDLLRQVHEEIQARYKYLSNNGQEQCQQEWRKHQDLLHSWQLPPEFLREKGASLDNRHTLHETWNDSLQRLYRAEADVISNRVKDVEPILILVDGAKASLSAVGSKRIPMKLDELIDDLFQFFLPPRALLSRDSNVQAHAEFSRFNEDKLRAIDEEVQYLAEYLAVFSHERQGIVMQNLLTTAKTFRIGMLGAINNQELETRESHDAQNEQLLNNVQLLRELQFKFNRVAADPRHDLGGFFEEWLQSTVRDRLKGLQLVQGNGKNVLPSSGFSNFHQAMADGGPSEANNGQTNTNRKNVTLKAEEVVRFIKTFVATICYKLDIDESETQYLPHEVLEEEEAVAAKLARRRRAFKDNLSISAADVSTPNSAAETSFSSSSTPSAASSTPHVKKIVNQSEIALHDKNSNNAADSVKFDNESSDINSQSMQDDIKIVQSNPDNALLSRRFKFCSPGDIRSSAEGSLH